MDRAEQAVRNKQSGMNCCQAVLCAFADELGLGQRVLCGLGAGFAVGMGTMNATCGALIAAQMICGLKGAPRGRALYQAFEQHCGATLCRTLKGLDEPDSSKIRCSCDDCVRNAARIAEGALNL